MTPHNPTIITPYWRIDSSTLSEACHGHTWLLTAYVANDDRGSDAAIMTVTVRRKEINFHTKKSLARDFRLR